MTGDPQAVLQSVLEAWDRSGVVGVRNTVWAMAPEDQVRLVIDLCNQGEIEPRVASSRTSSCMTCGPPAYRAWTCTPGPAGYRRFLQEWLGAFPDSSS